MAVKIEMSFLDKLLMVSHKYARCPPLMHEV